MSLDQPFYAPNRKPDPPRQARPTEHLWSIQKDGRQYDGELLDHGDCGVQVQFLRDREWFYGHLFRARSPIGQVESGHTP